MTNTKKSFADQYVDALNKARREGYEALTSEEKVVLEKGDDHLLG